MPHEFLYLTPSSQSKIMKMSRGRVCLEQRRCFLSQILFIPRYIKKTLYAEWSHISALHGSPIQFIIVEWYWEVTLKALKESRKIVYFLSLEIDFR